MRPATNDVEQVEPVGPDAAIVVTNHDYAAYLPAALDSALGQTGVAVEVIVVDDGSTDGSLDVLARYEAHAADRLRVVRQPNRGQGAAMNAGFALVRAPVVLFLDADDVLHPETAARACAAMVEPVVRVQFPMRVVDAAGNTTGASVPADPARLPRGDTRAAVLSHPDDLPWQPTSGNAFAASVLRQVLPMPEAPYRLSADCYLSNLTPLFGEVAVLDDVGADYRVHGANGDHRDHLDLDRVRGIIERTVVTHCELGLVAERLGHAFPHDPRRVPSVTFHANRLVSRRLAPESHPLARDRVLGLVALGARAAFGRTDQGGARRAAMALWFPVVALAPRPLARSLAERALVPRRRPSPPDRIGRRGAGRARGMVDPDARGPDRARGDWRLLLPKPAAADHRAHVLVRGAPVLPIGVELFDTALAGSVDALPNGPDGDLVVDLGGAADLASIAARLRPGGVAWVEVDRRLPGAWRETPARARRRAEAVGLRAPAAYLPAPDRAAATRYLPLDHAGALAWYLRTLFVPASRTQAAALLAVRLGLRAGGAAALRAVVPSYGLVVTRPLADPAAGPDALEASEREDLVRGRVDGRPAVFALAPCLALPPGTRPVVVTSGQDELSRTILVPFAPGERRPRGIVKVVGRGVGNEDSRREQRRLEALALEVPRPLGRSIPCAFGTAKLGRLAVSTQSAVPGRSIAVRSGRATASARSRRRDLDALASWVTDLHLATNRGAVVTTTAHVQSELLEPLADLAATEARPELDLLAGRVREHAFALGPVAVPIVACHPDLVPVNVLRGRHGVRVIDWEHTADVPADGPAVRDLLLFVTYWHGLVHGSANADEDARWFAHLLAGRPGFLGAPAGGTAAARPCRPVDPDRERRAAWSAVDGYLDRLGIAAEVVPLAMVGLWLARDRAERARARALRRAPRTQAIDHLSVLARAWAGA